MKYDLHIPVEQFGFISKEIEGTDEQAVEEYRSLRAALGSGEGLSAKEYNDFIDNFLLGQMNGLGELYQQMSMSQQETVQTIKRSLKRIKSRNDVEHDIDLHEEELQTEELINQS